MSNKIRFAHSFQYKQYHSLTLESEVLVEDSIDGTEPVVTALQETYGETVLKMFERYKENWRNADLQAYINAILPVEVSVMIRSNPILMDSLLLDLSRHRHRGDVHFLVAARVRGRP